MTRLDQRVKAVELRPVSLLTAAEVEAAVEIGQPSMGPETIVSSAAPWQFKRVLDGYVYSNAVTGGGDRVELYFEAALGAAAGDRIEVSGVNWASSSAIDVNGDNFTVEAVDTEPWDDRPTWRHTPSDDPVFGSIVSHTYYFKPESVVPTSWGSRRQLQTRRKVNGYEITGTTVTLTMNAVHHFAVDDIIFVGIFAEDPRAYGADGLFRVTAVTDTTIEYELSAGVDEPTGDIDVSAADPAVYVFPVAREWAQDGSIWIDKENNETYYWDGIRWVSYTPGAVPGDGDPPNAPTNFTAEAEIDFPVGSIPRVKVSLSWTKPTTSESGAELTDLAAYIIGWREAGGTWVYYTLEDPSPTSFTFSSATEFKKNTTYNFSIVAVDSGRVKSTTPATTNVTTPSAPATNIVNVKPADFTSDTPYLGTVTLYWQGSVSLAGGTAQDNPDGLSYLEIHRSTQSTYTPSEDTLIGTTAAVPNAKFVDGSLSNAYGTTFYYRAVLVDGNGTKSLPSDVLAVTAQSNVDVAAIQGIIDAAGIVPGTIVTGQEIIGLNITGQLIRGVEINAGIIEANSITADKIDVGNVTAQIVDSRLFTSRTVTGTNPPTYTGAGITFDDTGLYAYGTNGVPTFQINASTGTVTIGNYVQTNDLAGYVTDSDLTTTLSSYATLSSLGLYITASDASTTYLSKSTASSTYLSQTSASETYVTQLSAGQLYIAKTDDAGQYVTSISGDKITTGTIDASVVNVTNINAANITAGVITGRSLQTAASGQRIVVSSSSDNIRIYASDSTYGLLQGTGSSIALGFASSTTGMSGGIVSVTSTRANLGHTTSGSGYVYTDSSTTVSIGPYLRLNNYDAGVTGLRYAVYSTFNGSFTAGPVYSSDARLKENIEDLSLGLDFIKAIRPVEFTRIATPEEGVQYGVIAQEVRQALADRSIVDTNGLVVDTVPYNNDEDSDPILAVNYDQFTPMLIKSVQELSNTIATLEARIATLEGN